MKSELLIYASLNEAVTRSGEVIIVMASEGC
jgi:hypothetical protein